MIQATELAAVACPRFSTILMLGYAEDYSGSDVLLGRRLFERWGQVAFKISSQLELCKSLLHCSLLGAAWIYQTEVE